LGYRPLQSLDVLLELLDLALELSYLALELSHLLMLALDIVLNGGWSDCPLTLGKR
jgi:hypothetical protein